MFDVLDIGASGLAAQRARMDTIAGNLANVNTTRRAGKGSGPYQRRFAIFAAGQPGDHSKAGVHVAEIRADKSEGRREYNPQHPDAGKDGYVRMPNIDLSVEYVNMLEASRAYEANVTMMEVTKGMMNASLRLIA
jgi:flagellar basal-body rod protein FlgC